MTQSAKLQAISQALLDARRTATALAEFPGDLPANLGEAYAIQSMSIERWPDGVAGWKVGGIGPKQRGADESDRLAGPIFASSVRHIAHGGTTTVPIFKGGFAAIEAELVLELARDVAPSSRPYTEDELRELVAAVYAGAEIASSPMAAINQIGPPAVISDFGNNNGLLLGPKIANWTKRNPEALPMRVTVNDVVVGEALGTFGTSTTLGALRFLLQLCGKRGITLSKGTFVSTGAVTGIHDVDTNSKSTVEFTDVGRFNVQFEAMQAKQ